jgi:hypothetical protein
MVVVADLHTSTSGSASLKSDGSLCAGDSSATHASISNVRTCGQRRTGRTVGKSGLGSTTLDMRSPDYTNTIGEA